jgi:hypothetical protein
MLPESRANRSFVEHKAARFGSRNAVSNTYFRLTFNTDEKVFLYQFKLIFNGFYKLTGSQNGGLVCKMQNLGKHFKHFGDRILSPLKESSG